MTRLALVLALGLAPSAAAADPLKIDRTIGKEPAYQTKAPRYGLLVFGPEAKDRVWLVWDGDALYADRNGNGDLTDPGEKVAAAKPKPGAPTQEGEFAFELGDLTVGGRTHKHVGVYVTPLARLEAPSVANRPDVKAARARDPKASVVTVRADIDHPGLKAGTADGRANFTAGLLDLNGVLEFADRPAGAPVVHLAGPLQISFYGELPTLRVGRGGEFVLVVGTPGVGPGTFAMLSYLDTVPEDAKPVAEVTYQPAKPGDPPLKEKFEIKERC